jgi:homoserine O-succinyltransferase
MPVKIPDLLPAREILESENVFVMTEMRAVAQDIRPLRILIFNLMPVKETTEIHLLRVLSNTPLQVEVEFLKTASHMSKNTSVDHLEYFYKTFDQVSSQKYDGMIITGAPVEQLEFESVDYWDELKDVMEWSKSHVTNTFHICWGAQAGLYYHFGIRKRAIDQKMFGVFEHHVANRFEPLMRGFDDRFFAPHSRHTTVALADIEAEKDLVVLSSSDEAGVYIAISADRRQIFVTGHSEYDPDTLKNEYLRDIGKGLDIAVPFNYFPGDDPSKEPLVTWRAHAHLLYSNWLNYYVYQATPFSIDDIN